MHTRQTPNKSAESLLLVGFAALGLVGIYASVVVAELIGATSAFLYLGNEASVPTTALRLAAFASTILPVAYLVGLGLIRWSPESGRMAMFGVAIAFALVIVLIQIFILDPSLWSASLLKVIVAASGLLLVAYRSRAIGEST